MKNKKNYYFGKYYKFISSEGFEFSLIDADTQNGRVVQIITKEKSYKIKNPNEVNILNDEIISLDINQKNLKMSGMIYISNKHPLKKDVMGILRYININTKHNVYSMYHSLDGKVNVNDKLISFNGGYGYIEGDEGSTFPDKYIWLNSIGENFGVTISIARIEILKRFHIMGAFLIIKDNAHEYVFSTLNGLKIENIGKYLISVRKGRYKFKLFLGDYSSLPLLSPVNGHLVNTIGENLSIKVGYELYKGKEKIFSKYNVEASIERVDL